MNKDLQKILDENIKILGGYKLLFPNEEEEKLLILKSKEFADFKKEINLSDEKAFESDLSSNMRISWAAWRNEQGASFIGQNMDVRDYIRTCIDRLAKTSVFLEYLPLQEEDASEIKKYLQPWHNFLTFFNKKQSDLTKKMVFFKEKEEQAYEKLMKALTTTENSERKAPAKRA